MARGVQTMRTVRSNDGTKIAFERAGDGPDLIPVGGELIRTGQRGDAVASFLAGVGLPHEAVEGMRQSPEWPGLETMGDVHSQTPAAELTKFLGR